MNTCLTTTCLKPLLFLIQDTECEKDKKKQTVRLQSVDDWSLYWDAQSMCESAAVLKVLKDQTSLKKTKQNKKEYLQHLVEKFLFQSRNVER